MTCPFNLNHQAQYRPSWHRIIPTPTPRMTPRNSLQRKPQSLERTVFLQCFYPILTAGRDKPTAVWQQGRQRILIYTNQEQEQSVEPATQQRPLTGQQTILFLGHLTIRAHRTFSLIVSNRPFPIGALWAIQHPHT